MPAAPDTTVATTRRKPIWANLRSRSMMPFGTMLSVVRTRAADEAQPRGTSSLSR